MKGSYDAIVIGSGLGGLTAGALCARAGKRVLLLERNGAFGGAATTYHRGGLTIEAALHETADPRAAPDAKGLLFAALDLFDDIELVPIDAFYEVRCPLIGAPLTIPHGGFDAVEARLTERFPQHAKGIRGFLRQLDRTQDALGLMMEQHGALDWLAHAPGLPLTLWAVVRDARASLSEVLARYFGEDEAIKFAVAANLAYFANDPDTFWWLNYAIVQGGFLKGGGRFIKGGSHVLSDRLAAIIREEGGETRASREVTAIELNAEGGVQAVRHRPRDGDGGGEEERAEAPLIFANAAPPVIETMLPEPQRTAFMEPYRDRTPSTSLYSIALGLDVAPSSLGVTAYSTHLVPDWMTRLSDIGKSADVFADMPGERLPIMTVVDFNHIDSGLGGELYPVSVVGPDTLEHWSELDEDAYAAKKTAWLDAIIARLDAEWPGLAAAVREKHMATARTMKEHLNTPGGAIYGYAKTPSQHGAKGSPLGSAATAVPGLWIASSYTGFGGFSGSIAAGLTAARAALQAQS